MKIKVYESRFIPTVEEFVLNSREAKELGITPALVIPGGGDVDSAWYGMQRHPTMYGVQPELDAFEFALIAAADWLRIPIIGICRGMQLIAVYHGIRLIQDIPDQPYHHDLTIHAPNHPLVSYLQKHQKRVNSLHHQGVDPSNLPPNALCIASFDGVVEAMQINNKVGVQFHPEMMAHYDLFIERAVKAALPYTCFATKGGKA